MPETQNHFEFGQCKPDAPASGSVAPRQRPEPEPIAAPIEDRPRLRGQNARILELLEQGPRTNKQLAEISLKYTSRISDIRRAIAPRQIVCTKTEIQGVTRYEIKPRCIEEFGG